MLLEIGIVLGLLYVGALVTRQFLIGWNVIKKPERDSSGSGLLIFLGIVIISLLVVIAIMLILPLAFMF